MGGCRRFVTALGTPGLLALCLSSALPARAVDIVMPDTTLAYGSDVVMPLRLMNVGSEALVSVEFDIAFDPQILTLDSIGVAGTALENWLVDSVRATGAGGDTLRLIGATAADTIRADTVALFLYGRLADQRTPVTSPVGLPHVLLNEGSPPTQVGGGSITLSGTDALLLAVPDTVELGGTISIQITDVDADVSGSPDQVEVRVTASGDAETLGAVETGGATGLFTTSIGVELGASPIPGDGVVQAFADMEVSICSTDSLDGAGAVVERCVEVRVIGGDDGRLAATVVLQPGDTLRVRLTDTDLISADTADVILVNGRSGESESLRLPQTAAAAGVFYAGLPTAFGTVAGNDDDGVLLAQKGDTLWVRYTDTFTVQGDTATVAIHTMSVDPFGDASGNGNVRGFDAARILDHSVGALTLSGLDSLAANLDLQAPYGPITAFDASLVLQYRVGLLSRFPVQGKDADNHPQPEAGASARPVPVWLPLVLETGAGGWRLITDGKAEILSGHLVFDALDGPLRAGPALQGAFLRRHDEEGSTRVAFASAVPLTGERSVLLAGERGTPDLRQVSFNGGSILGRVLSARSAATAPPARFVLHPATPNPFNPTTQIRYELAAAAHTRLVIVNALGQQVRVLVDVEQPAGPHTVVWDGRDDGGRPLAAGTYFQQLRAAGRSATGKMVLAK